MKKNVPLLLRRYALSYHKEGDCIEYFITDKITHENISRALVLSLNRYSNQINVAKFYPELAKQTESKYLSAACFYLLIHHFAKCCHVSEKYRIFLQTRPPVYKDFYSLLNDFDLQIKRAVLCETVEVWGDYPPVPVDTSMIEEKVLEDDEPAFLFE
ncbi:hypothetical protein [Desulfonema magnum]|uniref:hypothetical protein n=1 Tax=Desulfonema magnum TaxID=45655 RepID=UPI001A9A8EAC|nr:hypothetical protein [Desulfonema magnum]